MNKILKSVCSLALAVIMVFNLFPWDLTATATSYEGEEIYLNTPTDVTVTDENPSKYFIFIPEESGLYFFSSQGDEDTYGYVFDEEGDTLYSNDDGGNGNNFKISAELTAGKTYILEARLCSYESGSFTVILEKSNISSIVFNDAFVIEGTGNIVEDYDYDTDESVEWVEYSDYRNIASGIITYDDGTTAENYKWCLC